MVKLCRLIGMIVFAMLPSSLKLFLLRRRGHSIGEHCYIGLSVVSISRITLDDYTYIGHFNLIWGPITLHLRRGARVSTGNWITGGPGSYLDLGDNSSVSIGHYFDSSAGIVIGRNCICAGIGSHFFSHGITSDNLDERMGISIGDWCYVGSSVRFVPGSGVADHTFVGMGAVVTKQHSESYVLLAGIPATPRKKLQCDSQFFDRTFTKQPHHPATYAG